MKHIAYKVKISIKLSFNFINSLTLPKRMKITLAEIYDNELIIKILLKTEMVVFMTSQKTTSSKKKQKKKNNVILFLNRNAF